MNILKECLMCLDHSMDVRLVFGGWLSFRCDFVWMCELNRIFLLKCCLVFDLRRLNRLLNHSLCLLLRCFCCGCNLRLDSFFRHKIGNGICLWDCINFFGWWLNLRLRLLLFCGFFLGRLLNDDDGMFLGKCLFVPIYNIYFIFYVCLFDFFWFWEFFYLDETFWTVANS